MKAWFLSLVLAFSMGARAEYENPGLSDFMYELTGTTISGRGLFKHPAPTIAEIEQDQYQFNSYPQFLDYLFKRQPRLKDRFVLLHQSASLQLASPEHPRVLAFDGGVTYSFSEHPENRNLRVEMLEVSPDDYQIKMSEIVFDDAGVKINKQPKACLSCHGQPAKMLWDPYDFWPQSFASSVGIVATKGEIDAYAALKTNAGESEILKRLHLPEKLDLGTEHNTAFTQYVTQINLASWVKQNLDKPSFEGWQWPLLWILNVCNARTEIALNLDEAQSAFPPSEYETYKTRLQEIYADTVTARTHFKTFQDRLLSQAFPFSETIYAIDHSRLIRESADMAHLHTIFDLGSVDASNLSTSPFANDSFIASPAHFLLDFQMALLELKPEWFAGLTISTLELGLKSPSHIRLSCDELAAKSQTTTRTWNRQGAWSGYRTVKSTRPVINRCARCHSEQLRPSVPQIPFTNSLQLANWLRDPQTLGAVKIRQRISTDAQGRMPPDHPLTSQEIESVSEFLKVLE